MHPPLRVVLPDPERARSLGRALEPLGVELDALDGHYELSIELVDGNPESRVVDVLGVIDRWLLAGDLPYVQVYLNGAVHTINSPREAPQPPPPVE